jgi:hypothetical protein
MTELPLRTRKDFFDCLEETLRDAEALAETMRGFPPIESILLQLRAMREMTAAGRTPTEDERDSISIGLIAVRELEPMREPALGDFEKRLPELEGYFREWPPEA